jgi:phosphatidate cytidylyltransferase
MSAAAFCLLVLNVLGTEKPKFAQLASSVFGLFYCGKALVSRRRHV